MENRTTYLLGAGASCNSVPIGSKLRGAIELLAQQLRLINVVGFKNYSADELLKERDILIAELNWLSTASKDFTSIDAFAKKVRVSGKSDEFKRLKLTLVYAFVLIELMNKVDDRYDKFISNIIDLSGVPSCLISVLTWNYDTQLERKLAQYLDFDQIDDVGKRISISSTRYDNYYNKDKGFKEDVFFIHKLNGTTRLKLNKQNDSVYLGMGHNQGFDSSSLSKVFASYRELRQLEDSDSVLDLTFAWENKLSESTIPHNVYLHLIKSVNLIIIGYSFPLTNREIDRLYLTQMKELRNVYIQDPNASEVLRNFKLAYPDNQRINFELIKSMTADFVLL